MLILQIVFTSLQLIHLQRKYNLLIFIIITKLLIRRISLIMIFKQTAYKKLSLLKGSNLIYIKVKINLGVTKISIFLINHSKKINYWVWRMIKSNKRVNQINKINYWNKQLENKLMIIIQTMQKINKVKLFQIKMKM